MKHSEQQMVALRLPKAFLKRLDKLAEQMSRPGLSVKRTELLRLAAFEGAAVLENEARKHVRS